MPANHVNKEVGGEMPVVKRVGRFRKDDRTMMVYDTENQLVYHLLFRQHAEIFWSEGCNQSQFVAKERKLE